VLIGLARYGNLKVFIDLLSLCFSRSLEIILEVITLNAGATEGCMKHSQKIKKGLIFMTLSIGLATPAAAFFNVILLKKAAATCDMSNSGFVQGSTYHTGAVSSINTATHTSNYIGAQTAGNLNVVSILIPGTTNTVSSVTDTAGNTYTKAIGPVRSANDTLYIYYAKNIASSTAGNEVTVTLGSNSINAWIDLSEYKGIDTTSPVDGTPVSGTSTTTAIATSSLTTTHACDLLYASTAGQGSVVVTGTGFRMKSDGWGDVVQDRVVSSTGSYSSTMTYDSGSSATAMVAFKKNTGTLTQNSIRKAQWNYSGVGNWVTTQTVPFISAQASGNLNVVVIQSYDNTMTVSSVTDTSGNTYTKASGPIRVSSLTQYIYYAKNIAAASAGANTVTVTLGGASPVSTMILEYQGLSTTSPLDQVASATSTGNANLNSGSVTTTSANELILGIFKTGEHGYEQPEAGSGFMPAANSFDQSSTFVEEKVVSSTGTYSATAKCIGSCAWVAHIVTFK
jgi:hypothetical protein